MMAVVRVMAVMRIVARGASSRVSIRKGKQRCDGGWVCAPGDSRLRPTDAEARVSDLGWSTLRKHRGEGDSKWYEERFFLHHSEPYAYR